jgi:thiamine pyrophosphate-dependent acetolactate synthase large subunit-like protein
MMMASISNAERVAVASWRLLAEVKSGIFRRNAVYRPRKIGAAHQNHLFSSRTQVSWIHTRSMSQAQATRPEAAGTLELNSALAPETVSSSSRPDKALQRTNPSGKTYTAAYAFFEALWELGVTHCFVNLGSDHPAIIEAMVKGRQERPNSFPRFITCPSEMVAMSMADGYARYSGKPQCVLVHVDVGTQALGVALHNASVGRAPVLIFAGMSPATCEGELRGSRTEWSHWVQDVPDQKAIVAQYCRYSAEIKSGRNIKQMVGRALQFATSSPMGPVYLCAPREVLEEEVPPYTLKEGAWSSVTLGALPEDGVAEIATALKGAKSPLIITGMSGRDHEVAPALAQLADQIKALRVLDTSGSEVCFPADHPAWLGMKYGVDLSISEADLVLVIDCDVPWVPTHNKPGREAKIFHIDADPLKQNMPLFYLQADRTYQADALTSIRQITSQLRNSQGTEQEPSSNSEKSRREAHIARLVAIAEKARPNTDDSFGGGHLSSKLRELCPPDTIFAIQAVTNTSLVYDNLQPTMPGHFLNCAGGGLGWSGGAALGIKLATQYEDDANQPRGMFVVQIVGDGSFFCSFPSSVYWISRKYNIPILTIILNNGGKPLSQDPEALDFCANRFQNRLPGA